MSNFSVNFSHPWLLLLLVLALITTFVPYFKISKKYRRNRNRIISLIMHLCVLFFSIFLLSGMRFDYEISNDENEILLLVDVSDSEENASDSRDEFVQNVINYGKYDGYKMGVVTFGFDQVYAAPLTTDINSIYDQYINAELPDTSATDIAAALTYAKDLINFPETSKIILVTDGKQTDEDATTVIKSITASGITVDTVNIFATSNVNELQIIDVQMPEQHINVNEECSINFTVQSTTSTTITAQLIDNGTVGETDSFDVSKGNSTLSINHTFTSDEFHEVKIKVSCGTDNLDQNNTYCSYVYIETFNKILILESQEGQSTALESLLTENNVYEVTVINVYADYEAPTTIDELRAYDQVILNNISNDDLQTSNLVEGFDKMLYTYVNDFGGGLFTVGGNDESGNVNAYKRTDLYGSLYQEMLPVEAINYTPPVGVMFIIDRSGSMGSTDGSTGLSYLDLAKKGFLSSLDSLSERDYVGLMTLDSDYGMILPMTARTREKEIRSAVEKIDKPTGGTIFYSAIERAAQQLNALKNIEKKHIIIITDGMPADQKDEDGRPIYEKLIENNYNNSGITVSMLLFGVGEDSTTYNTMKVATDLGHGNAYAVTDVSEQVVSVLRNDLCAPEIKEVSDEPFYPVIKNIFSPLVNGVDRETEMSKQNQLKMTLDGFYGTKARKSADVILVGNYDVPIYAQWKFGKGTVGSFMCDLNGNYSSQFLGDESGRKFIRNVINNLMPTENIRPNEINVSFKGDNLINQMSIFTTINEGESIQGTLTMLSGSDNITLSLNTVCEATDTEKREMPCYVSLALSKDNNFTRCNFVIRQIGVYQVELNKVDAAGNVLATYVDYKAFSYSQEYNMFYEDETFNADQFLEELAKKGNGVKIEDPEDPIEIFDGFVTELSKSFDPRFLFMILAIIMFLIDIAVRKFKFMWPHEIIRERKNSK